MEISEGRKSSIYKKNMCFNYPAFTMPWEIALGLSGIVASWIADTP